MVHFFTRRSHVKSQTDQLWLTWGKVGDVSTLAHRMVHFFAHTGIRFVTVLQLYVSSFPELYTCLPHRFETRCGPKSLKKKAACSISRTCARSFRSFCYSFKQGHAKWWTDRHGKGEPQVYLIHVAPTDSVGSGSVLLSWHMFICAEKQSPSFSFQPAHGLSCTSSCEHQNNKAFGWMGK